MAARTALLRACHAATASPTAAAAASRRLATAPRQRVLAAIVEPCGGRRRYAVRAAAAPAAEAGAPAAAAVEEQAAEQPHVSVLLAEVLAAFEGRPVRRYVDGTLGAGGHASAMLRQHPEMQALVGFDLDPTAHALASARLADAGASIVPVSVSPAGLATLEAAAPSGGGPTALIVCSNFGRMKGVLQQLLPGLPGGDVGDGDGSSPSGSSGGSGSSSGGSGGGGVDAILLDLGISSMQVDTADRGFSFLRDGPLDMRMDPSAPLSAERVVNEWPEAELGRVFREYGEERYWKSIARRIVAAREEAPITTTQQLVQAIGNPGGGGGRGGGRKGGRGGDKYKHPATRVFQALRIAVNGELQSIAQAIPDAIDCLAPGGRLAVITFHSLEDRIVKWAFRHAAGMPPSDEALPSYCLPFEEALPQATVKILTRRPVAPSPEEQAANVRSRSAKLRVVEKL